jgi:hypothetical protein
VLKWLKLQMILVILHYRSDRSALGAASREADLTQSCSLPCVVALTAGRALARCEDIEVVYGYR